MENSNDCNQAQSTYWCQLTSDVMSARLRLELGLVVGQLTSAVMSAAVICAGKALVTGTAPLGIAETL